MSGAPATPVLPAGLPEEWVQARDLPCPTCGYNLRMLHLPRCPECGTIFRWQQLLLVHCPRCNEPLFISDDEQCPRCKLPLNWARLLDSAIAADRRLYEYSPHPVRAALRTWVAAMSPWRFWARIPIETPPVVSRLLWLRRAAVAVCALGVALVIGQGAASSQVLQLEGRWLAPLVLVATLPVVTFLGLPRFTPTLVRFQVRPEQLLRCTAYASSGLFWIGLYFLFGFFFAFAVNVWLGPTLWTTNQLWFEPDLLLDKIGRRLQHGAWSIDRLNDPFNFANWLVVLFFGLEWWWVFLYVGLRRYLRLSRGNTWALLLSTQTIGLLLLGILLLQCKTGVYFAGVVQMWIEGTLKAQTP